MKLEDALELMISKRSMLRVTSLHDGEDELEAMGVLIDTLVEARKTASQIFCVCNTAPQFEVVAKKVFEILEIPSASPYLHTPGCPVHRN